MQVLQSAVAKKQLKANSDGTFSVDLATGKWFAFGPVKFLFFTTAITANTTTTTAAVGSLAFTSNATGAGSIFRSDGTKWQFLINS